MEKKKLLIIDDSDTDCRILLKCLTDYDCQSASSPAQAIKLAKQIKPDLVLVDYELGKTTGLEMISKLSKESPKSAFIIITAHESVNVAVSALKNGAIDFILKPYDAYILKHIIKRTLNLVELIRNDREELSAEIRNHIQPALTILNKIKKTTNNEEELIKTAMDNLNKIVQRVERIA